MRKNSEVGELPTNLFKGKPMLVPFLFDCGTCILTTPNTHKEGKVIKLIEKKGQEIRFYHLGDYKVKSQSLASKEQLMIPVLSLSFNPITRKSEACRIPFTAGWIKEWEIFKTLLYEDHEFAIYSHKLDAVLSNTRHSISEVGNLLYAIFRPDYPPLSNL